MTVSSILSRIGENANTSTFDPSITAAGVTVAPATIARSAARTWPMVQLTTDTATITVTPAEARALAAALQAVALYQDEQNGVAI